VSRTEFPEIRTATEWDVPSGLCNDQKPSPRRPPGLENAAAEWEKTQ
jgi:hypothetical protein